MVELREATVHWDAAQKSVILKEGVMETEGGAYGYFNDTLLLSGWGVLEICAGCGGTAQRDETTFFLAGYLEGYLTAGWENVTQQTSFVVYRLWKYYFQYSFALPLFWEFSYKTVFT